MIATDFLASISIAVTVGIVAAFFVGFSGGKDSIVTLALCRMAGVKHTPYYTYTTIDPPEVAKFIRTEYPKVV